MASKTTRETSVERFDLGGDVDLEGRLSPADTLTEKSGEVASVKLPATLAADDPENPRNWTPATKMVASLRTLMERFHMSEEVAILGVTFSVFGFAAGPLLWGPASEIYGRRAVYILTGIGFSAFSWGAAFAPNAASLLIFRFLLGFFGASTINNVPASIGDYTTPKNRLIIVDALMAFGGPALGPLLSAFIQDGAGFRWNLRVMAIFTTVLSIAAACVPETHGPTLLKWRLAKEGKAPPSPTFSTIASCVRSRTRPACPIPLHRACRHGHFHLSQRLVWYPLRILRGIYCRISRNPRFLELNQTLYMKSVKADAARGMPPQPEARLALAYYGAILSPISLFIFAWTAPFKHVHWIAPCIGEFLFACSMLLIFTGFIPYLVDCYGMTAASALAAGMASRALVGSIFPLFSLQMYHGMTVQGCGVSSRWNFVFACADTMEAPKRESRERRECLLVMINDFQRSWREGFTEIAGVIDALMDTGKFMVVTDYSKPSVQNIWYPEPLVHGLYPNLQQSLHLGDNVRLMKVLSSFSKCERASSRFREAFPPLRLVSKSHRLMNSTEAIEVKAVVDYYY
ncbi:major facilitator superfamily domain-containing protein [Roridomyces roridus]|uniref:Major facilitator superfamily domain-containing protein n=1 Tax=Roridomyces roridus TaxID=1738132 RepID=A0AAD7B1S9_9AGAR|nr:major facilitator superfamily domain-containing protein [Roridomyces roridus]